MLVNCITHNATPHRAVNATYVTSIHFFQDRKAFWCYLIGSPNPAFRELLKDGINAAFSIGSVRHTALTARSQSSIHRESATSDMLAPISGEVRLHQRAHKAVNVCLTPNRITLNQVQGVMPYKEGSVVILRNVNPAVRRSIAPLCGAHMLLV